MHKYNYTYTAIAVLDPTGPMNILPDYGEETGTVRAKNTRSALRAIFNDMPLDSAKITLSISIQRVKTA